MHVSKREGPIEPFFNWVKDKLKETQNIEDIKGYCELLADAVVEENSKQNDIFLAVPTLFS